MSPATRSGLAAAQLTAFRWELVPELRELQLNPPSPVAMIVPLAPTATQTVALTQLMPFRSFPSGLGFSHWTEPSLRRGPTFELGLGAACAGTAPASGGRVVVEMSAQQYGRTTTAEVGDIPLAAAMQVGPL